MISLSDKYHVFQTGNKSIKKVLFLPGKDLLLQSEN
jgi:hypothetical protein